MRWKQQCGISVDYSYGQVCVQFVPRTSLCTDKINQKTVKILEYKETSTLLKRLYSNVVSREHSFNYHA